MIPFQITFLDFPESDAVWLVVQNRIEKIEQFFSRIVRCEVAISLPHRHRHADRLYHIQIRIFLPGDDIIVTRKPAQNEAHRDIYVAIRDSFNAAERLLREKARSLRGRNKARQSQAHLLEGQKIGKISKIFYNDGFGFLITNDGREFYFNKNSILNKKFEVLEIGQKVRFLEELGEKGPKVTSMVTV